MSIETSSATNATLQNSPSSTSATHHRANNIPFTNQSNNLNTSKPGKLQQSNNLNLKDNILNASPTSTSVTHNHHHHHHNHHQQSPHVISPVKLDEFKAVINKKKFVLRIRFFRKIV